MKEHIAKGNYPLHNMARNNEYWPVVCLRTQDRSSGIEPEGPRGKRGEEQSIIPHRIAQRNVTPAFKRSSAYFLCRPMTSERAGQWARGLFVVNIQLVW